ncbi:DUF6517 family protein [Halomarina litorea]|uniref:DUF6517 family protein n=1 Tax=Halomarina litorea TaxID=2961595 RepID=UPI0020C4521E|nr:DUF6517 family protein [Halomarina sp. BCD28]
MTGRAGSDERRVNREDGRGACDERGGSTGTTRRRVLGGAGAGVVASLAGCLDVITGSDSLQFSASAATVAEASLSETGYSHHRTEEIPVERTFETAGQSRTVEVTNVSAEYDRTVEIPTVGRFQAAVFAALSTPKVEVLGKSFNPVADMSTDDIARMVQERYENVRDLRRRGSSTVAVLGTDTEVAEYVGAATLVDGNAQVDVTMLVSEPVAAGADFVVCVGAYPRLFDERASITTLMRGVEHAD